MRMLKRLYDKSRIWFAVVWIASYCVLFSVGDALSEILGIEKSVTLAVGLLLSALLLLFLKKNGLFKEYGLCRPKSSAKSMLYYAPIFIMLTANLWYGVTWNYGIGETMLYVLSMLCVGFLEEMIFRGLLFEAMRKDSEKAAVIVSSVTFGMGHIINLINGSGAELLPNLLQVVYATAAGFMFVMIYVRSESLIVCIAAHGLFNSLSVFANEANATDKTRILTAVMLALITGGYAVYLAVTVNNEKKRSKPIIDRHFGVMRMDYEKVYNMKFSKIFSLLIAKAEKKNRTRAEVAEITSWLTGYTPEMIEASLLSNVTYGDFFRRAPNPNPKRTLITGAVCGVRVENVEEDLMREMRYLDKLVDELAKGKAMDKILRE